MATLYELNAMLENFELEIDEDTGEILNADALDALELERDAKIENIALWIKNLNSDAEAYKKEKDNFYSKEKASKNKADRLKAYLESMLQGEKFKSAKVTISYRKSESLQIEPGAEIADIYLKPQEPQVDKIALKEAIKGGAYMDGVTLVIKNNMQIR